MTEWSVRDAADFDYITGGHSRAAAEREARRVVRVGARPSVVVCEDDRIVTVLTRDADGSTHASKVDI